MKRIVGKEALREWLNTPGTSPVEPPTETEVTPVTSDDLGHDGRGKIVSVAYPEFQFTSRSGGMLVD